MKSGRECEAWFGFHTFLSFELVKYERAPGLIILVAKKEQKSVKKGRRGAESLILYEEYLGKSVSRQVGFTLSNRNPGESVKRSLFIRPHLV